MKLQRRLKAGMGLPTTLVMIVCGSIVAVAVLGLSTTSDRMTHRTVKKAQATALAESGVNVLFDRIKRQMVDNNTYPDILTPSELYQGQKLLGTYSARVADVDIQQQDVMAGSVKTGQRDTYTFKLEGTGRQVDGIESKVTTTFTAVVEYTLSGGGGGSLSGGIGAIVSNSKVNIETDNGVRTYDSSGNNQGHIVGNDGISFNPQSGPKVCVFNPNVIDIEGAYLVPDGPAYTWTTSWDGLNNENGVVNYENPDVSECAYHASGTANSITKLNSPVSFANSSQVDTLAAAWKTTATGDGSQLWSGATNSSSIPQRPGDQWRIIQAPAYLDGDLTVTNGDLVRLMPNADPAKNIVYVKGNIKNFGQLFNLGVTVVVEGKYSDGPTSEYRLDPQGSPFNETELMQKSTLVSLSPTPDAFSFQTNSSSTTGLMFAAKGGMEIVGSNAEFRGAIWAGGEGANGNIRIRPGNGASFVVHYDANASVPRTFGDTGPVTLEISRPFRPSKMKGWVRVK